jgi:hypothetical protein
VDLSTPRQDGAARGIGRVLRSFVELSWSSSELVVAQVGGNCGGLTKAN